MESFKDKKDLPESATTTTGNQEIKKRIVEVASVLFAEKSYEGASVREIASQSSVNIAMISYYFGGKEGLYLECIATFAKGRIEVINRILTPVKTADEFKVRLKLFFESMMSLFTNDKHLVRIIVREAQTERGEDFHKKVMEHMHPVFLRVQNYYQQAIDSGVIAKQTNAEMLTALTMACLSHPCMMEKAIVASFGHSIESSEYQSQYIKQICDTIFNGVLA